MKNLVIVESPSKSKTIEKYLGSDYKVLASMGHIRDLATSGKGGYGVDIENGFKPNYITMKGKSKTINMLKKEADTVDNIILATDPDREGEAISWHLKEVLGKKHNYQRVTFNEITKDVVINAINNPRDIDMALVKSQETRRILDRIIGFSLSKFVKSKTGGDSAGRVQSVALKLVVDRDREIEKFVPQEYYKIYAKFDEFDSELEKFKGKKVEIHSDEEACNILNSLSDKFVVSNVEQKESSENKIMPFKTSTLQQSSSNILHFNSKKTMMIAQKLYEGVDIGSETVGLITYMRTDSERLSPVFINSAFKFIEETYGKEYVGSVKKQKKNDNMQDAHEGIRVTSVYRTPDSIREYLSNDEYKLYKLIYARSLACLMAKYKKLVTNIHLDNNGYEFKSTGSILIFDGFLKIYSEYLDSDDKLLPDLTDKKELKSNEIIKEQRFTKPESKYTESSLIKELEKLGIGRPSTYATIIEINKLRKYIIDNKKKFDSTELGQNVTDVLQNGFSDIINIKYTANMEKELDDIAESKIDNVSLLNEFYNKFEPLVDFARKSVEKVPDKETGEMCPLCNNPLVIRKGKYGQFIACSNYPECNYIKSEKEEIVDGCLCPDCGSNIVVKKGPYGKYQACANYPECKYIKKDIVEICDCPSCSGKIIERKTKKGKIFYGCNNFPKCKNAYWDKPTGEKCSHCGSLIIETKEGNKCSSCANS